MNVKTHAVSIAFCAVSNNVFMKHGFLWMSKLIVPLSSIVIACCRDYD